MRITGGRLKGRRLSSPKSGRTRPTPAKVREALFSIIGKRIERARVLDLFAGSGAMGIEALSRGAASSLFVDADPASARLIEKNIDSLGLGEVARVMKADVFSALRVLSRERLRFDVIILDPPYGKGLGERAVRVAADRGVVAAGAIIMWEHSAKESPPDEMESFGRPDTRLYGDSALTILKSEAVKQR